MKTIKKASLLFASLALVLGAGLVGNSDTKEVKAEDIAYKLAISKSTSNSSYTKYYDSEIDNITWSIPGNQTLGDYAKIGGKLSSATTRLIYSKNAISSNIGKIVVNSSGKDSQITLSSLAVKGYSTAKDASSGTTNNLVFTKTITTYSNTMTFDDISGNSDLFYRFEFTMTSTSSSKNYGIKIESIDFYEKFVPTSALSSITLSGQKTEYYIGDTFSFTGDCTATFDDKTSASVTPTIVNMPDMSTTGKKEIKVSYTLGEITKYATYTINVTNPFTGEGTIENPYTVADAIVKAKQTGTTATTDKYYIKGIICDYTPNAENVSKYGNIIFSISDDGVNENTFLAFQVNYLGGNKFTSSDQVAIGDAVVIYGNIVNYNGNTPETTDKGTAYVYSHTTAADLFVSKVKAFDLCNASVEELKAMLDEYDALIAKNAELADSKVDETTTLAERMAYMQLIYNKKANTTGEATSGVVITSNNSYDKTSLIALFAILGIVTISGYYIIEKKKFSK